MKDPGVNEALNVEWRGEQKSVPVITMPLALLSFNPDTHRVRAQRTLDPARDQVLTDAPYSEAAQKYLSDLLRWDPADPDQKVDSAFDSLKEDLQQHGQNEPGLITHSGILINGNTRAAALRDLGVDHIRVGVLPSDASPDDTRAIELSLQLRRDLKREYSFVNLLLAIDERIQAGWLPAKIQKDFRIAAKSLEKYRWVLAAIYDLIERSRVPNPDGGDLALRLTDFERDQGKFDELHRAYAAMKPKNPDGAEALREQRLLAILLDKSKTDVRLVEADFAKKYMTGLKPKDGPTEPDGVIPGTTIPAPGPSAQVSGLKALTTEIAQARAVSQAGGQAPVGTVKHANEKLEAAKNAINDALDKAGKNNRIVKKKLGPSERLSDANEDLSLTIDAIAQARTTHNFDASDLEDGTQLLRANLVKLAQAAIRSGDELASGRAWLKAVAELPEPLED